MTGTLKQNGEQTWFWAEWIRNCASHVSYLFFSGLVSLGTVIKSVRLAHTRARAYAHAHVTHPERSTPLYAVSYLSSDLLNFSKKKIFICWSVWMDTIQVLEENRRQGEEDQAFEKRVEGKKAAAKKRATRRSACFFFLLCCQWGKKEKGWLMSFSFFFFYFNLCLGVSDDLSLFCSTLPSVLQLYSSMLQHH